MSVISDYLAALEHDLQRGQATEHTHRPALKALLEGITSDNIHALNEPTRISCGAPDLVVMRDEATIGYVEAKDVGISLHDAARSEQLQRYRSHLPNLLLTDYLSFIWYVDGEERERARLATWSGRRLQGRDGGPVRDLLRAYLAQEPPDIVTPEELARRMADLTRMMRDIIVQAILGGRASHMLQDLRRAMAENLIPELNQVEQAAEFADMYAQTLAYGLFAARANYEGPGEFRRQMAAESIPRTNPFLRDLFGLITGPALNQEPYAGFVKDLVQLLNGADMYEILRLFGKRTRQEDPIVHFYETFLREYDPQLREQRGVYYTPDPVVSYIVRSVDHILRTRFDLPGGLADESTVTYRRTDERGNEVQERAPRVLILDPATGTGTFLYHVVDHIRERFMRSNNAGMWSGYVRNHLLPRLFGFELLMAPYAVAHLKLGLQLDGRDLNEPLRHIWRYDFGSDERLGVFLTNTLEEAEREVQTLYGPFRAISEEARAAARIKRERPIMVVIGNPPYSVSSVNKSEWIEALMDTYKAAVRSERNIQPLSDDYIKFIRFAHDRIERTGYGVVGFITNHSYLFGLIHRGMRESLLQSFSEIFVLNLHGNSLIGETPPDGIIDQNVFDIRQGVAIVLLVSHQETEGSEGKIRYYDLWGSRSEKYEFMLASDVESVDWQILEPTAPSFFFVPRDASLESEYQECWSLKDIFLNSSTGVKTHRDRFAVSFDDMTLRSRIQRFADTTHTDEQIRSEFRLGDTRDWTLSDARRGVSSDEHRTEHYRPYFYRPFDNRYIYYSEHVIEFPRPEIMQQMLYDNICLVTVRQLSSPSFRHIFATKSIGDGNAISINTREYNHYFPLYLYPSLQESKRGLFESQRLGREANLSRSFINALTNKLGLAYKPYDDNGGTSTFGSKDILHYIYSILNSQIFRERYVEFLKIDFPRVPITSNVALFRKLCELGEELIALHLMESPLLNDLITSYPVPGDHEVAARHPRYLPPGEPEPGSGEPLAQGRVYINREQYFGGAPPEVWAFCVGGYQVLDKWLKDRKGRQLSYEEIGHYQRIVVALKETMRVMAEIDEAIAGWPLE